MGRRKLNVKINTSKYGAVGDVKTKTSNESLQNLSQQIEKIRANSGRKGKKTSGNTSEIDSIRTNKTNDTSTILCKDLNFSLAPASLYNTSTPYQNSKTQRRHLKKKKCRRKRNMIKSSLDFENNTKSSPVDEMSLKLMSSETSLLDLSLPTPRPPRAIPESLSTSYDASYKDMEDSSDDEDLPVGLTPLKIEKSFSENDIVWVKWKKWPFIPALVKKVYRKKKRLTCALFKPTDFDKNFTMGYGNPEQVVPFCDPRKDKILAEAENLNTIDRDFFRGSLAHAENFLAKEALKSLGEAGVFKENLEQEKEIEVDHIEEKITPCRKRRKLSMDSDCIISKVEKKKNGLSKQGLKRIERMSQKTKPLTDFLVSDITKDYLRRIYSGDKQSELHDRFLSCSIRERAKMKHRGFGPIDDESQIELLLSTYLAWLNEINKSPIHEINYVFDVWVPEAVVFALRKQKGYGRKQAWEQFNKGVRRTKEELRQFHEEMMQ